MNQIPYFKLTGFAIIILIIWNCAVCHGKSANVKRVKRFTDDESFAQLQHHHKTSNEAANDQRNINAFKDLYNSDKIIFDHGDLYQKNKDQTTAASTTNNNSPKANETNHRYAGKANGEYEFR